MVGDRPVWPAFREQRDMRIGRCRQPDFLQVLDRAHVDQDHLRIGGDRRPGFRRRHVQPALDDVPRRYPAGVDIRAEMAGIDRAGTPDGS